MLLHSFSDGATSCRRASFGDCQGSTWAWHPPASAELSETGKHHMEIGNYFHIHTHKYICIYIYNYVYIYTYMYVYV